MVLLPAFGEDARQPLGLLDNTLVVPQMQQCGSQAGVVIAQKGAINGVVLVELQGGALVLRRLIETTAGARVIPLIEKHQRMIMDRGAQIALVVRAIREIFRKLLLNGECVAIDRV